MLLEEKMELLHFSPSEENVIEFIKEKQELIENYSTTEIAAETYTSPSILVRISKKLGFTGWRELKKAYLAEIRYLKGHFADVDANKPFNKNDDVFTIANKIAQLKQESIQDTLALLDAGQLRQAVKLLRKANVIKFFGLSNQLFLGEEFIFKLRHIGKTAELFPVQNTMFQEAVMSTPLDCAVIVSYSGESDPLFKTVRLLQQNQVPIIAITSIGENRLEKNSDVVLHISTREKSFSKIAGFSSLESVSLILDILYSCYFSADYEQHWQYKLRVAQLTEFRELGNRILQEE